MANLASSPPELRDSVEEALIKRQAARGMKAVRVKFKELVAGLVRAEGKDLACRRWGWSSPIRHASGGAGHRGCLQ